MKVLGTALGLTGCQRLHLTLFSIEFSQALSQLCVDVAKDLQNITLASRTTVLSIERFTEVAQAANDIALALKFNKQKSNIAIRQQHKLAIKHSNRWK
ncbi:MAG TPA: hypothetical protein PKA53_02110 [Sphingobacterium sp.]|nr:hypothetical protein [Sphingobacterium sp.]